MNIELSRAEAEMLIDLLEQENPHQPHSHLVEPLMEYLMEQFGMIKPIEELVK